MLFELKGFKPQVRVCHWLSSRCILSLTSGAPDSSLSVQAATSTVQITGLLPTPSISASASASDSRSSAGFHAFAIAGEVVGSCVGLALLLIIAVVIYRRKHPLPADESVASARGEIIHVTGPVPNPPLLPTCLALHLQPGQARMCVTEPLLYSFHPLSSPSYRI